MARYPFPSAPIGWFQVAWSDELPIGRVMPVRAFGRELVAARGEDGVARAFDAHCPHLGAHLGYGGLVSGATLICPFHGWCFDGDGACVSIPSIRDLAAKIPPRARLVVHPVREVAGMLLVHHHPAGAAPAWEPPALAIDAPRGPRFSWRIRTHVQEIAENVVDPAHFLVVHGVASMPETTVEAAGHVLRSRSRMNMSTARGAVPSSIDADLYGLGMYVFTFRGIVDTVALATATPVEDEQVELRFAFYVRGGSAEHGVGAALIADVTSQVEADIPIWEHKVYRERPALCAADEGLLVLRRWAKDLYATS